MGDPHPTPAPRPAGPPNGRPATGAARPHPDPHLRPRQQGVDALGPLDLDIAPGEFICIVGPSGCGKSTLLRIAAGLLRPSAGELEIRTARTARPR